MAHKKNKMISIGTIFAGLINLGLNVLYLPKYGYEIAGLTTVLSYLALLAFHWIITEKYYKINFIPKSRFIISLMYIFATLFMFLKVKDVLVIRYLLLIIPITILGIIWKLKKD